MLSKQFGDNLIKKNKLYHTNIYKKKWLAIDNISHLKKYGKI